MYYPDIEIFITSLNQSLFDKCKKHLPNKWKVSKINGRGRFYGIESLLAAIQECKSEIMVMLDEDAFVANTQKLESLLSFFWHSDYACCGVRDGGIIDHRLHNPLIPNLFFCALKIKQIKPYFSRQEILANQHLKDINQPIFDLPFAYKYDLFEPYYCLFLWLLRKGLRIYYLEDVQNGIPALDDKLTTVINYDRSPIVYHSWFAREYQKNPSQTKRIDRLLHYLKTHNKGIKML